MTAGSRAADGGQAAFIQRIRDALGVSAAERPDPDDILVSRQTEASRTALERTRNRSPEQRRKLLEHLQTSAPPINLKVRPVPDLKTAARAAREIVLASEPEWGADKAVAAWSHPLIEALELKSTLAADGIPVHTIAAPHVEEPDAAARAKLAEQVRASFVGMTGADYCVAESATLVMKTRSGEARSVSLVPSIHIAVIRLEQIVASFTELYSLLCFDPTWRQEGLGSCLTFISGPSKTADIEAYMVHGAHGPRAVHLLVIENGISNKEQ